VGGTASGRRRPLAVRLVSIAIGVCVLASAALLCVLAVGTALDRWRLAPVLSGSMSPEIPRGAVVLAEPVQPRELRAGDVLLFTAPIAGHPLVVHRIHDVAERHGVRVFHTKGDANDVPDVWQIRVTGPLAWRVRHELPYVGTLIGLLSRAGLRMIVLVVGVGLLMVWGLGAIWARRPISWRADDPYGVERRRAAKRTTRRALAVFGVGAVLVGVLGAMGLAYAQFTHTPTPPAPPLGTGQLPTPTGLGCTWKSTSSLDLSWTAVAAGFATGYNAQRANASGGPYSVIGSVGSVSTTTFTDSSPGPPTVRYYVVTSSHGTWDSAVSNEIASKACIGAITLDAGTTAGFSGDNGQATSAQLNAPRGVAVDSAGNVYVADTANNRIRKVDTSGVITTIAGGGANTACTFSGPATSVALNAPRGVAVDSSGSVYIADTGNACIRKVTGTTISQVAGGGANTACTFAGTAASVSLSAPGGIAVDSAGAVYVADTSRSCVRKVSAGNVSQVAGGGANTACSFAGAASSASLSSPGSVAVDSSGNVYIADTGRSCVRKVTAGNISLLAGGGASTACTFSGAASSVSLSAPAGVAVDGSGNVYVADTSRLCVRKVAGGNVSQVAGTGASGSSGDNGPAVGALFTTPAAVAVASTGDLWVADAGTHRVRQIEGPV
jgi:signal peptidase I